MSDIKNEVKITYSRKVYLTESGITAAEFLKRHDELKVANPVAAVINGHMTRLTKAIKVDAVLDFVPLASPQGQRIYETSIAFLFLATFKKLYPNVKVFIQHSLSNGLYCEPKDFQLTDGDVARVQAYMEKLVREERDIGRERKDWDEATSMFMSRGRLDMIDLLRYYPPQPFKVYQLDGYEENFYLPLVENTKTLKQFKLMKYQEGLVILFPNFLRPSPQGIIDFVDKPKLYATYKEYRSWSQILKVRTVGQLNRHIMSGEVIDLIKVGEALHEKKVAQIADTIKNRKKIPKAILISGPSSSGKTTFSLRLKTQLMVNGLQPINISLDDYFVDRELNPKDENGNYDFECLEAVDTELFNKQLLSLVNGHEVEIPRYDFRTGSRKPHGRMLKLGDNQILTIEGIHALNPKLTNLLSDEDKFRIYIAPLTQLNMHNHDRISTSDTRIIRRIVRDSMFRGYSATETLARWPSIRLGEFKNIYPTQEEADVVFNSALFYELALLKRYAERELLKVERDSPVYPEARRLLKFLSYFLPVDAEEVPSTSLLREFIGGSTFRYH